MKTKDKKENEIMSVTIGECWTTAFLMACGGIFLFAIGIVGFETLCAAIYWPFVTVIIIAITKGIK